MAAVFLPGLESPRACCGAVAARSKEPVEKLASRRRGPGQPKPDPALSAAPRSGENGGAPARKLRARSDRPFGGRVAPGAGAGGADGADLEPVLRAAGQAGDGAARGFADVALRPGSVVFPGPFPQRQRRRLSHQTRSRVERRQIPRPADLPGPARDSAPDGMNPPDRCQRRARKKRQD